jgi:hypothetical protein
MTYWREWMYWKVSRPAHKAWMKMIWALPRKVVYWCVVRAAVTAEPDKNPGSVTSTEMMEAMS